MTGVQTCALPISALDPTDVARQMHDAGFPILVTFTDITKPESVKKVDPANLAASFGPGVKLKTVTLEITSAPVTEGTVETILGWWLSMRSGPFNEMTPLHFPNSSPRGWDFLGALSFWSLDRIQAFKG